MEEVKTSPRSELSNLSNLVACKLAKGTDGSNLDSNLGYQEEELAQGVRREYRLPEGRMMMLFRRLNEF